MALQLYAFKHNTILGVEIAVRAHSREQASDLFANFLFSFNEVTPGAFDLSLVKEIPVWTLPASGFPGDGIINGGPPPEIVVSGLLAAFYDDVNNSPTVMTPDSVANSVSEDFTFISYINFADYSSGEQVILGKFEQADKKSFLWSVLNNGNFQILLSVDGSAQTSGNVTSGLTDGVGSWVRMSRDGSSGACVFFISADDPTTEIASISWGTAVGTATLTTTNVFDGAAMLDVGARNSSEATPNPGFIYRSVLIKSTDPDETILVDCYPDRDFVPGVNFKTFTSSTTGEEYTLGGSARIVEVT